jgi:preprotein translocase subunit SecG
MLTILLIVLHVFASIFLVLTVLLQSGKGSELGAAFGGASQTVFGQREAATFLSKLTTAFAIIFMITSISLTHLSAKRVTPSILEDTKTQKK